ncbi:MAG: thymidine phosphorylase, partial [Candidatus Heimdallarchaeota archaeon]|nr:thymidine phosphorylase [Candidatus Heimdallarchaeota archaeon]
MKLIIKIIPLDSPFALVNAEDFPKKITYPCQLRVSKDSINFPIQAYLTNSYVATGEIGISDTITKQYGLSENTEIEVQTRKTFDSIAHRIIIEKVKGRELGKEDMDNITQGFMNADISPSHSSAFLLSQHFTEFTLDEIEAMARSFADSGKIYDFSTPVFDKHSIGGVPGNKITLLIVPILAAAGLLIPKTSTHAITSASGTADTMSVLAPVELNASDVLEIVKKTKGCIVSGRDMGIAPVVDKIIQEAAFPLGIDPESLFLAGILA